MGHRWIAKIGPSKPERRVMVTWCIMSSMIQRTTQLLTCGSTQHHCPLSCADRIQISHLGARHPGVQRSQMQVEATSGCAIPSWFQGMFWDDLRYQDVPLMHKNNIAKPAPWSRCSDKHPGAKCTELRWDLTYFFLRMIQQAISDSWTNHDYHRSYN